MWPNRIEDPAQVDDEVRVMASSKKMVLVFIASLLVVLLSVWLVSIQEGNGVWGNVGLVTGIIFSVSMGYALFRLVKPKPAVIVNRAGFLDQSTSSSSKAFIRWTEVQEVFIYEYMGHQYLGVRLKDTEQYVNQLATWKRPMTQANLNLVKCPISIPQSAINVYVQQLFTMMHRRWKRVN